MHRLPPKGSSYCLPREISETVTGGSVSIFTILFVILLIAWILGWGVFHIASALIHILLVVALISLVLHFIRGPRAV
jgi:hypothetical protein